MPEGLAELLTLTSKTNFGDDRERYEIAFTDGSGYTVPVDDDHDLAYTESYIVVYLPGSKVTLPWLHVAFIRYYEGPDQ